MSLLLVVAASLTTVVAGPPGVAADARSGARIRSTILDPRAALLWDDRRWDEEISSLNAAGIDDVVLQASADLVAGRIVTYFPGGPAGTRQATAPDGTPVDIVHALVSRAAAAGLTVWVGLLRDLRPNRFAPAPTISSILDQDAAATEQIADALAAQLPLNGPVAGWYLPAEINTDYVAEPARSGAIRYLSALTARLHGSDGGLPVMIAPYFHADAGVTVPQWRQLWTELLRAAPLDVVALQDGTGDTPGRPADPSQLKVRLRGWYGALRDAVDASSPSTQLWAVLDLYDFTGASAVLRDVAAHYESVSGLVSGYTSFSFTNQISPWTLGTTAYATPFDLWNRFGETLSGRPSPPRAVRVAQRRGALRLMWRPAVPAHGKYLAYYRVFLITAARARRYAATVWATSWKAPRGWAARRSWCAEVVAYDTTGDASYGARACGVRLSAGRGRPAGPRHHRVTRQRVARRSPRRAQGRSRATRTGPRQQRLSSAFERR